MTDRELMQQALEALEETSGGYSQNLIAALRDRLAQPEQERTAEDFSVVEPVVWALPKMHPVMELRLGRRFRVR